MNEELKTKLAKIYELVNRGATEGERAAAKKALDRIIDKHNITAEDLYSIDLKEYKFSYTSSIELTLFIQITRTFTEAFDRLAKGNRTVHAKLNHLEWVTIESAYEYFRRHMKAEWKRLCAPELSKCKKPKTKAQRRAKLQNLFITKYIIASNLYKPENITTVTVSTKSKEYQDRIRLSDVQGGEYNRQLGKGLLLDI